MKFAYSTYATDKHGKPRHCVGVIDVADENAAIGLALRIARKCYPVANGWENHDVVVTNADNVVTLETAVLINKD